MTTEMKDSLSLFNELTLSNSPTFYDMLECSDGVFVLITIKMK